MRWAARYKCPKKMATAKMSIDGLSSSKLVPRAQSLHDGIKENTAFPSPLPTTAAFQALIDELAAGNAAVDANGGRQEYRLRDIADRKLRSAIKQWRSYVQMVSGGDADLIESTNFGVSKRPHPRGELSPPRNLGTRLSSFTGRAALVWASEEGANMHHVYMSSSNEPFNWELIGVTTKSRFNADHLEPGTFYWFAVSAINTAGESSKSEPCRAMAAA